MAVSLDLSLTCRYLAEPPEAGTPIPLQFERLPRGVPRCYVKLCDGVKIRLQPRDLERMICESHAEGRAIRVAVKQAVAAQHRTRVTLHLELMTPWAAERPSNLLCPEAASRDLDLAVQLGQTAEERLSERIRHWAGLDTSLERRALRQGLIDTRKLVTGFLEKRTYEQAFAPPQLFREPLPIAELLHGILDEAAKIEGHRVIGSRARGRFRGLQEGLHIVADTFGVDPLTGRPDGE